MYDHSLHHGRKKFCFCLHAFITEEILDRHIKDCFKINSKQRIKMQKKVNMINSKILKEKNYSFIIYADFESILVLEDNGKQNPNKCHTNKFRKHLACKYSYKLAYVDDKFSNPLKSYLDKEATYNFISSMTEEGKCRSNVMKKHFNKELVMTKEDNENFENSTECWICDNDYIDGDVKVRDHCHTSGKYRGSADRYCNINLKLNHKIPMVLHNLKIFYFHLIMQELGSFSVKINVYTKWIRKAYEL